MCNDSYFESNCRCQGLGRKATDPPNATSSGLASLLFRNETRIGAAREPNALTLTAVSTDNQENHVAPCG